MKKPLIKLTPIAVAFLVIGCESNPLETPDPFTVNDATGNYAVTLDDEATLSSTTSTGTTSSTTATENLSDAIGLGQVGDIDSATVSYNVDTEILTIETNESTISLSGDEIEGYDADGNTVSLSGNPELVNSVGFNVQVGAMITGEIIPGCELQARSLLWMLFSEGVFEATSTLDIDFVDVAWSTDTGDTGSSFNTCNDYFSAIEASIASGTVDSSNSLYNFFVVNDALTTTSIDSLSQLMIELYYLGTKTAAAASQKSAKPWLLSGVWTTIPVLSAAKILESVAL